MTPEKLEGEPLKRNQFFGFPCCSTRENLSNHVANSYYYRTDIDEARVISTLHHK